MALENTVENLDGIDEKFATFYTEKDGKYELDDNLRAADPSDALLNAKNHERDARIAAENRIKELEKNEDDYNLKLAEAKNDKDEVERLKQKALDKQKLAHDTELQEAKALNHELTIGIARNSIAAQVYINQDAWKLTDLESRIKLSDDGKSTYLVNALGETVTEQNIVDEYRAVESMAWAVKGATGSGGGSSGANSGSSGLNNKKWSDLTMAEKKAKIASGKR